MADENDKTPAARDLRLRQQYFPDAEALIFDSASKGYGPLPILLRKLIRHMKRSELGVLIYLYTRASKYRICYPTLEEIGEEVGLHRRTSRRPSRPLRRGG